MSTKYPSQSEIVLWHRFLCFRVEMDSALVCCPAYSFLASFYCSLGEGEPLLSVCVSSCWIILTDTVNINMSKTKDTGLEVLLALNGDRYFVDERGEFEAIFNVNRVAKSPQRPSGISYSLVLLNADNERVVCFDNAHTVSKGSGPGKIRLIPFDHI